MNSAKFVLFFLKEGDTTVGREDAAKMPDIGELPLFSGTVTPKVTELFKFKVIALIG